LHVPLLKLFWSRCLSPVPSVGLTFSLFVGLSVPYVFFPPQGILIPSLTSALVASPPPRDLSRPPSLFSSIPTDLSPFLCSLPTKSNPEEDVDPSPLQVFRESGSFPPQCLFYPPESHFYLIVNLSRCELCLSSQPFYFPFKDLTFLHLALFVSFISCPPTGGRSRLHVSFTIHPF